MTEYSSHNARNPFEKLSLGDRRRPIEVLDTVEADVPEASRRFLDHKVDAVRFKNGKEGFHHRIKVPEGIMLAHINANEEIALVQNYRHAIGRDSVELPSGGLSPEETRAFQVASPEEREIILKTAAIRETREETGEESGLDDLDRLFPGPLQGSVGFADQTYHIFHAEGQTQTVGTSHDDGEIGLLTHNRYSLSDATEMIGREIVDPATSAALGRIGLMYGVQLPSSMRNIRRHIV